MQGFALASYVMQQENSCSCAHSHAFLTIVLRTGTYPYYNLPRPLGERNTFLMRSVKSAFTLLLAKVTKPAAERRKQVSIRCRNFGGGCYKTNNQCYVRRWRRCSTYIAENVDQARIHLNIEYCYTPIEEAYHQLFDEALAEFNAKQKRNDRCIENYYEKIRDGKQEKTFYKVIFPVGNKDDMGAVGENAELAKTILDKFYVAFWCEIPIFMFIQSTCTLMKQRPIFISTSSHLPPGASEDCLASQARTDL